jgi:hypothetical protein
MNGSNTKNVQFRYSAEQDWDTSGAFVSSRRGDSSESPTLSYTCILVPGTPSQPLLGDLADYVSQQASRICNRYGWLLEFTTINPDYFQWGLRVDDSILPTHFVEIIRSETSKLILSNFENITLRDPSDDFWAPGHLILHGARPESDELIKRYIRLIRR